MTTANEALIEHIVKKLYEIERKKKILIVGPATLDRDPSPLFFAHEMAGTNTEIYCLDLPKDDPRGSYRDPGLLKTQLEQIAMEYYTDILMPEIVLDDVWLYGRNHAAEYDLVFEHMTAHFLLEHGKKGTDLIRLYRRLTKPNGTICLLNNSKPNFTAGYKELLAAMDEQRLMYKVVDFSEDIEMASKYPILINFSLDNKLGNFYSREHPYMPIVPIGVILPRPPGKTQHEANVAIIVKA